MSKPQSNRLSRFLALERRRMPHRNTLALIRRRAKLSPPVAAYLRIDRGYEA
jgi:hypothetical protein